MLSLIKVVLATNESYCTFYLLHVAFRTINKHNKNKIQKDETKSSLYLSIVIVVLAFWENTWYFLVLKSSVSVHFSAIMILILVNF